MNVKDFIFFLKTLPSDVDIVGFSGEKVRIKDKNGNIDIKSISKKSNEILDLLRTYDNLSPKEMLPYLNIKERALRNRLKNMLKIGLIKCTTPETLNPNRRYFLPKEVDYHK